MKAAIYVRISDDRKVGTDDEGLGIKRQEDACQTLCQQRGWDVAEVYADNDLSAYSGKSRPAYEAMLDAVERGEVGAIVAWATDRLTRQPKELERFIDVVEEAGAKVATVTSGDYDLSTPEGRAHSRIVGAIARQESERKSVRAKAKAQELAAAGKLGGGGTRPFGFKEDRVTLDKREARVVRKVAAQVIAGMSLRQIARDLDAKGVTTVSGKAWTTPVLRRLLTAPRTAGLRGHRGEVVADAQWEAILDRETWEQVRAILLDPSRRKTGHRRPHKYLLTGGILVCGREGCGASMVARPTADKRRKIVCAKGPNFHGCGKLASLADPLEEFVGKAIIDALTGDDLSHLLAVEATPDLPDDAAEELSRLEAKLASLGEDYAADLLDRRTFLAAERATRDRIDKLASGLAARTGRSIVLDTLRHADGPRGAWEAADLDWRRALVEALVEKVVLAPAVKGRNYFDAQRVTIKWRA